ncbi:hypothetical protein [Pararcticibacter amylolyticus]|uniref:Uncharacterized protein n=1 Tax=Pararcticibacter amylolyticus TaxID=2173175 RepID=A0A2U2PA82_9SPHI|nr:hypothetical protein [Pararcticibacter amylolyticus]PWG78308.1 hypothetical protein DDR33_22795 [Pararcticibacter amylolyticus]
MAVRDRQGNLRGRAGDKINRVLGGKNIVQAIPDEVNQTEATKKCSGEWGLVSTTGKVIRKAMSYICDFYDSDITNRLTAVVKKSITASDKKILHRDLHDGDTDVFAGFQFNIKSPVDRALKVKPEVSVDENYRVSFFLPAFSGKQDVVYPKFPSQLRCSISVHITAFNLRKDYFIRLERRNADVRITENEPLEWYFSPLIPEGGIVFVCLSLAYFTDDNKSGRRYVNGKDWCPATILTAFHAGPGNTDEASSGALDKEALNGYMGNELIRNFLLVEEEDETEVQQGVEMIIYS